LRENVKFNAEGINLTAIFIMACCTFRDFIRVPLSTNIDIVLLLSNVTNSPTLDENI